MPFSRGDTEAAFQTFCNVGEQYFCTRLFGQKRVRAYCGRGLVELKKKQNLAPFTDKDQHCAISSKCHRLMKLARRIEELSRKLQRRYVLEPIPAEWWNLWEAIRRDGTSLLPHVVAWLDPNIPDLPLLLQLGCAVRNQCTQQRSVETTRRKDSRASLFKEDWADKRKLSHAFCRGEKPPVPPLICKPDGTFTGDRAEIDGLLCGAWLPIFRLYGDASPPRFSEFQARFGNYFPQFCDFAWGENTVESMRETLKKAKTETAIGVCGWRVAELKALPDVILSMLCEVFGLIERVGSWPAALRVGIISMVPKSDGGLSPKDLRPISVMSTVYRLWAAMKCREVLLWQEMWASDALSGFRLDLSCEDSFWSLALDIEQAHMNFEGLCGISIDFEKAFDRVPWQHVFEIGQAAGLPESILRPLKSMYMNLTRHFRIGGMVGRGFVSTNGILQGCPLSIILLNLLMQVWASAVENESGCKARCYADDAQAAGREPAGIKKVVAVTKDFCSLTGMRMNVPKSHTWATEGDLRQQLSDVCVNDEPLDCVCSDRFLGAQMAFTRQHTGNRDTQKRRQEAEAVLTRISSVPLPLEARAQLVESMVNSKILFDTSVAPLSKRELQRWRSRIVTAIWGNGSPSRCLDIVFTLCRGHAADPLQASIYRILSTVKRMLTRHPQLIEQWSTVVNDSLPFFDMPGANLNHHGPVYRFAWAAKKLGWEIVDPLTLRTSEGTEVQLLQIEEGYLQHVVRDEMRLILWKEAALRRPELDGIQHGVDREATMKFANSLRGHDKRLMYAALAAGIDTRERKFRRRQAQHPCCLHCDQGVIETPQHIVAECPAWQRIRRQLPPHYFHPQLAPCAALCGIVPEQPQYAAAEKQLENMNESPHNPFYANASCETHVDNRVVSFTDGSCKRNSHKRLRRAGCGI